MSLPATVQSRERTLGNVLRELAFSSAADTAACPWCRSVNTSWRQSDTWPPRTALYCEECGTRLEFDRRLPRRAVRA